MTKPIGPRGVTVRGRKIIIEGYENAVGIKCLTHQEARQLRSYSLHQSDLNFCRHALDELRKLDRSEKSEHTVLATALWVTIIARYFKCFGRNPARISLNAGKIFKPFKGAIAGFDYYKHLRNKHLIHDENSRCKSLVGIVLNPESAKSKIEGVVSLVVTINTFDDEHLKKFEKLLEVTRDWVAAKSQELHDLLDAKYEKMDYKDLLALAIRNGPSRC